MIAVARQRPQARRRQGNRPLPFHFAQPTITPCLAQSSLALQQAFGQFHVEMFADGMSDVNEQELRTKIKKSGGADYDQGSNAGGAGYQTSAHDIKAQAKGAYLSKEKETNIGPVIFEKSALPQTTPIDLKGRPMVAPPSEAMRNVNHTGNLDVDKFKGKVSVVASGGESAPAPAPAPAPVSPAPASAPAPASDPAVADAAAGLASALGDMMSTALASEQGQEFAAFMQQAQKMAEMAAAAAAAPGGGFDASLVPAEEPADPAVIAMPGDDAAKVRAATRPFRPTLARTCCNARVLRRALPVDQTSSVQPNRATRLSSKITFWHSPRPFMKRTASNAPLILAFVFKTKPRFRHVERIYPVLLPFSCYWPTFSFLSSAAILLL
jgi:hypothetical protein